jgi:hypothetical protein
MRIYSYRELLTYLFIFFKKEVLGEAHRLNRVVTIPRAGFVIADFVDF